MCSVHRRIKKKSVRLAFGASYKNTDLYCIFFCSALSYFPADFFFYVNSQYSGIALTVVRMALCRNTMHFS